MSQEIVSISLPAKVDYARSVRMMAASLSVVCGMNVDEVEDIRMAAEEGFVYACSTTADACDVEFCVESGTMQIKFKAEGQLVPEDEMSLQLSKLLLDAVCDSVDIASCDASTCIHLVKSTEGVYGN